MRGDRLTCTLLDAQLVVARPCGKIWALDTDRDITVSGPLYVFYTLTTILLVRTDGRPLVLPVSRARAAVQDVLRY